MSKQIKLGLGSVLGTFGALGIVLVLLLEWPAEPRPWGFLLVFVLGIMAGLGVTLAFSGLIDLRRSN
jgi:hypothetical protein